MQQTSCKLISKAFIKLIEPRKQTRFPYSKGNTTTPPWWPNTMGQHSVHHKEPDHLPRQGELHLCELWQSALNLKLERVRLLVHVLRMAVKPWEKQCPTAQKMRLSVKKLEEAAKEAIRVWLNDKDHPENAAKEIVLREIFSVARAEERCNRGEIGEAALPQKYQLTD